MELSYFLYYCNQVLFSYSYFYYLKCHVLLIVDVGEETLTLVVWARRISSINPEFNGMEIGSIEKIDFFLLSGSWKGMVWMDKVGSTWMAQTKYLNFVKEEGNFLQFQPSSLILPCVLYIKWLFKYVKFLDFKSCYWIIFQFYVM